MSSISCSWQCRMMRLFYDVGDDAIADPGGNGSEDDEGVGGLETGI
jgi:hypothetical protein